MMSAAHAEFDFRYVLDGTGWATATLFVGRIAVEMTSSNLGDPISEWLLALVYIGRGARKASISFVDEPGEHLLKVVSISSNSVDLELWWFSDSAYSDSNAKTKLILSATIARRDFEQVILRTAGELREKWGLKGYKYEWSHPFPSKEYDRLIRELQ